MMKKFFCFGASKVSVKTSRKEEGTSAYVEKEVKNATEGQEQVLVSAPVDLFTELLGPRASTLTGGYKYSSRPVRHLKSPHSLILISLHIHSLSLILISISHIPRCLILISLHPYTLTSP
jgi:hypothetical protein